MLSRYFGYSLLLILLVSNLARGNRETTPAQPQTGQVAVFSLSGELPETPPAMSFDFAAPPQISLHKLIRRIDDAAEDEAIEAIVLTFDEPLLTPGRSEELAAAIERFKKTGKKLYTYLEEAELPQYVLASAASEVYMVPTGTLALTGVRIRMAYFKNLMDKIGITADIVRIGSYKGAAEPFMRNAPSEPSREMLNWMIDQLYTNLARKVASNRNMPEEKAREVIGSTLMHATQAKEAGLIDGVAYPDELADKLRSQSDKTIEFVHDYGVEKKPQVDLSSPFGFFKLLSEAMRPPQEQYRPTIAVIHIDGMIVLGRSKPGPMGSQSNQAGSENIREAFARALKDERVKAAVLRIDSPGGSATASEIMWHAAEEFAKSKPLVVSMGNVAASGGYYVAMAAPTIFANENTFTGSIGVLGGKVITEPMWHSIGLTFHSESRGQAADMFASDNRFTAAQRETLEGLFRKTYETFTQHVADNRGEKLSKPLPQLAGGRVFLGTQARELGLIDEIGGLSDAIDYIARQENIQDYAIRTIPEPENFLEAFMKALSGEQKEPPPVDISIATHTEFHTETDVFGRLAPSIAQLDRADAGILWRAWQRLKTLRDERMLMALPTDFIVE